MLSLTGRTYFRTLFASAVFAALALSTALSTPAALAAGTTIYEPGEPIVTGFSGVVPPAAPPAGSDPLDYTFIDPDGHSLVIQQLAPDAAASGQLIESTPVFGATAKDVGQVFGVTLDNAPETTGADAPNIYLSATSAYGLNIVVPDPDGNPVRSKLGAPDATWMPGQWGGAGGETGYPGSIWKIDGSTGEVSLFTTIAANSGAGLSGIVYDADSDQFFVSDLDTGLIYRLASDGTIVDSFDHGVTARPTHDAQPAVPDDGSAMAITDPAFNSEDPTTWGTTQPERRVGGLAMHGGRLYYAVADGPQIWSVRINDDGSFGTSRWEFDVTGLPSSNEIASIVFDPQGRMILAQRGPQVGSYDYSVFAEPGTSSVVRYAREFPDDPATPSVWKETPDSYAIGLAAEGANASGGIALGPNYDAANGSFDGSPSAMLWATGDSLRDNPDLTPPPDGPAYVHGLQGTTRTGVRPLNDPPLHSFFADYDGNTSDDTSTEAGHVGAVAIWQSFVASPPDVADIEPPDFFPPPDFTPPEDYNLSLEKWSSPHTCFNGPGAYWCNYTIRVENTGTVPYWGQVSVHDQLPANPPGATMSFWPGAWSCGPSGPGAQTCTRGPVFLFPGDAVVLHEVVKLPKPTAPGVCNLLNIAGIQWPFFGGDDDPTDDFDGAVAFIPAPGCVPGGGVADLMLNKFAFPSNCIDPGGVADYLCNYGVVVTNVGPGNYSGPIQVKDTLGVNAPATIFGPWTCGQVGPVLTCNINAVPVNKPPGWSSGFVVQAHMKKPVAPPACNLNNKANITVPLGGSPNNILPGNDFDTAVTHILSPACLLPAQHTDIEVKKTADACGWFISWYCKWTLTITNVGPNNYAGPLKFTDVSAFANTNNLPAVIGLGCSGPAGSITCTYPAVLLTSGTPHSFTFYTTYLASPSLCSATNTASIVTPNPGSVQNPSGNDSVSVGHAIPNPACAGLPVLNITKTAKGCASDPSSPDWLCKFDVAVKNVGGAPQPIPLKVRDYNLKPTTFTGAACPPAGLHQWLCSKPTPLAPGATWTFTSTTHVDPNGVTLADCDVVNTVWIDTPFSWDPGHFAQAHQKVPQLVINPGPGPVYIYCDPPSLKLKKVAGKTVPSGDGYDSTFTITATSTGPDPYHGTVELDELLPDGTTYKSSSWPCVPASGNDVHCSSAYQDLAVGQSTSMTIVIHIPKDAAVRGKCSIVNTVNISISAEVLHSDVGAQYTASAKASLPADACVKPPVCSRDQLKPDGTCCDPGLKWNGRKCAPPAPPPPNCPSDSHVGDNGQCVCDKGTIGKPGHCVPTPPPPPVCSRDSHLDDNGQCVCDKGTSGKPGHCVPNPPNCPRDSSLGDDGQCHCDDGTHGKPGRCVPDQPAPPQCPRDSSPGDNGQCQCDDGTHGKPGRCVPDEPAPPQCPRDSHPDDNGGCQCDDGTHGRPGRCVSDEPTPPPEPNCPRDSHFNDGACRCDKGTHGDPGQCVTDEPAPPPVQQSCPDDSHFDRRAKSCVCNPPLVGDPGNCQPGIILKLPTIN